jgi:hypothetical protein
MEVRRRRQHDSGYAQFYIVNFGKRLHDRGVDYKASMEPWVEGKFTYTREEYAEQVEKQAGFVRFNDRYWEDEPDQEVFDAVCRRLIEDHAEYTRWLDGKIAKDATWGEIKRERLALPKGTCRMVEDGGEFRWSLTLRQFSEEATDGDTD